MNKWSSNGLMQSVICTAVFAAIFGLVVACGGGKSIASLVGSTALVRLATHSTPNMTVIPSGLSGKPFLATLLQTQQGSQLQQSFQGTCPFSDYYPLPSSGYIPFDFPDQNNTGSFYTSGTGADVCAGVFVQIGGGVDQRSGLTLVAPGTPMIFAGTLTTLVVTGVTNNGNYVRCTDVTDTASVNDGDKVEAYWVAATNSVILGIGATQLPFVCNLTIAPGDEIRYASVQFAKI